jgi:hypothetical protein
MSEWDVLVCWFGKPIGWVKYLQADQFVLHLCVHGSQVLLGPCDKCLAIDRFWIEGVYNLLLHTLVSEM